jgi:hypothetical protein
VEAAKESPTSPLNGVTNRPTKNPTKAIPMEPKTKEARPVPSGFAIDSLGLNDDSDDSIFIRLFCALSHGPANGSGNGAAAKKL